MSDWLEEDELLMLEAQYLSLSYQIGDRAYKGEDYQDLLDKGMKLGDRILELDPDNKLVKG